MFCTKRKFISRYTYYYSTRKRLKSTSSHVSFSSSGKKLTGGKFPISSTFHLLIRGSPDAGLIDDPSFSHGAKQAVESVTHMLSRRDIAGLSHLVTHQCLLDIRENILERLPAGKFSSIPVKSQDIFLQFISYSEKEGDRIRITTNTYSLPGYQRAIDVWREYKNVKTEIHFHASKNKGILKKEHMNTRQMRKTLEAFDDFNINKQAKAENILVTRYVFEKLGDGDWKLIGFSHADTGEIWNIVRQLIWKGRLAIAVGSEIEFQTYLRYEALILILSTILFIYLQFLAISIGIKYEEAARLRQERGEDF